MSIHLQRQVDKLKSHIRRLGAQVESAVEQAVRAVEDRDRHAAQRVITEDDRINQMEVDVEEECLHTLALHQPVAFDLRYVVAVLKINNDLERMGDHAVSIAEQALFLAGEPPLDAVPYDLNGMTRRVRHMLRRVLSALVDVDAGLADTVREADDEVDAIHRHMYEQVKAAMRDNPEHIPQLVHMMNLSRQLERIADLTVNIAEDVLYMARGDILRHPTAPTS